MAEKKETKTEKRRAQINQLPKEERPLSKDEQKKIKGGFEPQPIAAEAQRKK